ncbi:hypothetical protein [Aquisalimonas sp.]|uniref:hypothetical protein n=1 Tax=unclassified Aquisalimonas TaxID=2644645 RepID=UPI0025C62247|nr:hypothetical protein [Aquisalimonas sp.]
MTHLLRIALAAAAALLLAACDTSSGPDTPGGAYEHFFVQLSQGERETALETFAPEGALGDTFRGGAYYTYADAVETHMESHGGLDEVIIDNGGDETSEDVVRVEGRLRFGDGSELERAITFEREGDTWVGRL